MGRAARRTLVWVAAGGVVASALVGCEAVLGVGSLTERIGDAGAQDSTAGSGPDSSVDAESRGPADRDATATSSDAASFATDGSNADAGEGGERDASGDACPAAWFEAPTVDPSIAVPDGGGGVLFHADGSGTQNYACALSSGTTYAWTLVTPEATLRDCHGALIGHHFASEAGAGFPEWQTTDGAYVIGTKHLPSFTPDGGAGAIPWLLLNAVDAGGSGTLSTAQYIQRLNTEGGDPPATTCDVGSVGTTEDVPYTADYYFYGP